MAIACSPDDLAEGIACLDGQSTQTSLAQMVYLLCQLNGMTCDPDTLAEIPEIACLQNWDQQSLWAAAVYELCMISSGGAGTQEVYEDVFDDPNGNVTPVNPTKPARYSQLFSAGGTGVEFHWQPDTADWQ